MNRILTIARTVWLEMLRRKDFYVLFILMCVMLFTRISVNIFGLGGMVRYLVDVGLLLAWLFSVVLGVTLVARQLPKEEEKGTIFPLLAKPISRAELLIGKWLGAWSAVVVATLIFYVLVIVIVLLRRGPLALPTYVQGWLLHVAALSVIVAMTLALSTRMSSEAVVTTSFAILGGCALVVPRIPVLVMHADKVSGVALMIVYYALPHFELMDMRRRVVHEWGAASWGVILGVLLYAALATAIFMLLAWLGYRRRCFKRGEVL